MAKPRGNSYATKRDVLCEKLTRHVSPRTDRVSSEFEIFRPETEKFEIIATVKLFLFFSLFYFSFPSSFSFFEDKDKEMIIVFSVEILWKRRDLRSY